MSLATLRNAACAAAAVVRHPRLVGLLALQAEEQDGRALAGLLAVHLTDRERRRLAFAAVASEPLELTFSRDGLSWTVDAGDEIGESVYVDGHYSAPQIAAVLAWLGKPAGRTIVDIGANIGTTTLPLASAGYHVVAVEPVPSTFAMLSRNVTANGFDDLVRCVDRAVTDSGEPVEMWVTRGSGVSQLASDDHEPSFASYGGGFADEKQRIVVPSAPLDAIVTEDSEQLALVWSDTEGCESYVIATGGRLWAAGVPLFVEVSPMLLERQGGLNAFLELVEGAFGGFLTTSALRAGAPAAPIGEFRAFAESIGFAGNFSEALLIR